MFLVINLLCAVLWLIAQGGLIKRCLYSVRRYFVGFQFQKRFQIIEYFVGAPFHLISRASSVSTFVLEVLLDC